MRSRSLGKTGLEFTELGFGGGAIGSLYRVVARDDERDPMTGIVSRGYQACNPVSVFWASVDATF